MDLLQIPRRHWLGCLLKQCEDLPLTAKTQRLLRKRFLTRIKNRDSSPLIKEVLRHESGRNFQLALEQWAYKSPRSILLPLSSRDPETSSRRCSIVINTVDRADELALTLESLSRVCDCIQDEIIIVLGPTMDNSEAVIRRSALPCRLFHCPEKNLADSRNLGWQASNGRYVAFIDDDSSPASGWLDALLEPFEQDPRVGISAGFVMDGKGEKFLNRYVVADTLGQAFWFEDSATAQTKINEIGSHRAFLTATGCNVAFRRSALSKIGGFDPFYQYFLEETDVVWRAMSSGYRCVVSPDSLVFHRLGSNLVRKLCFDLRSRIVVIRSQIHYIEKFGKATFLPKEIESALWERALLDLEKIAWDCGSGGKSIDPCADLQRKYLQAVANEFNLDPHYEPCFP